MTTRPVPDMQRGQDDATLDASTRTVYSPRASRDCVNATTSAFMQQPSVSQCRRGPAACRGRLSDPVQVFAPRQPRPLQEQGPS